MTTITSNAQLVAMIATTEDSHPLTRHQLRTERAQRVLDTALAKALEEKHGNELADDLLKAIEEHQAEIDKADLRLAEALARAAGDPEQDDDDLGGEDEILSDCDIADCDESECQVR